MYAFELYYWTLIDDKATSYDEPRIPFNYSEEFQRFLGFCTNSLSFSYTP